MTVTNEVFLIAKAADDDVAMLPLSKLASVNGGTGVLDLEFNMPGTTTGVKINKITLTTGADEFAAAKALMQLLNAACRNTKNKVITLANGAAGTATITAVPEITGCSVIS